MYADVHAYNGMHGTFSVGAAVMKLVESCGGADRFSVHLDLHETTDTDETEFRPVRICFI